MDGLRFQADITKDRAVTLFLTKRCRKCDGHLKFHKVRSFAELGMALDRDEKGETLDICPKCMLKQAGEVEAKVEDDKLTDAIQAEMKRLLWEWDQAVQGKEAWMRISDGLRSVIALVADKNNALRQQHADLMQDAQEPKSNADNLEKKLADLLEEYFGYRQVATADLMQALERGDRLEENLAQLQGSLTDTQAKSRGLATAVGTVRIKNDELTLTLQAADRRIRELEQENETLKSVSGNLGIPTIKIDPTRDILPLHEKAMFFAQKSLFNHVQGYTEEALMYAQRALGFEEHAAGLVPRKRENEPSRSVLYQSAATLAIQCEQWGKAQSLILAALEGWPPPEIEEELKVLLVDVAKKDVTT
jgi:hypothetical protein